MGRERQKKEDSIKPLVAELFVERSFSSSFQIIRELKVTDVRRKRIPLLWSTIREREREKKKKNKKKKAALFCQRVYPERQQMQIRTLGFCRRYT